MTLPTPSSIDYPKTAYRAPETFIRSASLYQPVDIYSLGVILHETLTGLLIRRDPSTGQFIMPIDKSLPLSIRRVVEIATHEDPKKRYQSSKELFDSLVDALGE
jgi:serine/threonine protein kinase